MTVPDPEPLMDAVSASGLIVTNWNAVFVAPLRSVTVSVTLYGPLTAKLVEKLTDVPEAGLPPVTAHAYVYGEVPPETVEVKLNSWFTVPVVGPVTLTASGVDMILTSWNVDAVLPLRSVTASVTLYVPFTANVVENVEAVPLAGLPPVTAHAYVYGDVPPLTVDVKLSKVLTEPEVGPPMVSVRTSGETVTSWKACAATPVVGVTVSVTLYVFLTAKLVEKVDAVPLAGLPPVTAQLNVGVPQALVTALKVSSWFTVPVVGPLMLALHPPEMVTSWNVVAVLALRSVTVSVMLKVPLVAKLVEKVEAVPLDGLPPVTAHA